MLVHYINKVVSLDKTVTLYLRQNVSSSRSIDEKTYAIIVKILHPSRGKDKH